MIVVRHHWQDRWLDRLSREFIYNVARCSSPGDDHISYRVRCKFYPQGLFEYYQIFATSVEITFTSHSPNFSLEYEISYHLQKRTQELRRMLEKTLMSGYSSVHSYERSDSGYDLDYRLMPIMDNWRITK